MATEPVSVQKILAKEFEPILLRRKLLPKSKESARNDDLQIGKWDKSTDVRVIPDTIGLSIAGGGLPAIAFASGAFHALAKGGFLQMVDYISCSEEGALSAACLLSHLVLSRAEALTAVLDSHKAEAVFSSDRTALFSLAAERAMVQLRDFCTVGCRCKSSCYIESFLLFVSIVLIPPLLVLSAASALSSPIDSILGETLRKLLTSGLSSFSWYHAGSLVLFAPLLSSFVCFAYSSILAGRARLTSDLRRSVLWDLPRSQAAAAAAGLGLSAAGLIVLMFIDERLLGGAPVHLHVHPVALLGLLPLARLAVHVRLLPSPVCVPTFSPATAAAGIAVCVIWAAARIFAGRVMRRLGAGRHSAEDAAPLLAFALLVWAQRACYAALAQFYRRRLRCALPSNRCLSSSAPSTPASVRLGDVYHSAHRPMVPGLATMPTAAADMIAMLLSGFDRWSKTLEAWCNAVSVIDAGSSSFACEEDEWALGRFGGGDVPYLLANVAVAGYAPPDLHIASGARAFVVSPVWCGSGSTGFFRTPGWMTLSRLVAICCSDGPLAGPGRLGLGLRSGNRMRLPDVEEAQAEW